MRRFSAILIALLFYVFLPSAICAAGKYQNFTAAIYARVYEVRQMGDPAWLEPRWNEISRQVKVDEIYLETHRDMIVADEDIAEIRTTDRKSDSQRIPRAAQ